MAAASLAAIRALRPAGPYHLGGLCNGGFVAFEVARLLRDEGEDVGLLALVNTSDRNSRLHGLRRGVRLLARALRLPEARELDIHLAVRRPAARVMRIVQRLSTIDSVTGRATELAGTSTRWLRRAVADIAGRNTGRAGEHARPVPLNDSSNEPVPDEFALERANDQESWDYFSRATKGYAPPRFAGPVTLIFWEGSDALDDGDGLHYGDDTRGWARVSDDVRIRRIAGEKRDLLTRDANALGRELNDLLRAEALDMTGRRLDGASGSGSDGPSIARLESRAS
jgi:hypothetical protein